MEASYAEHWFADYIENAITFALGFIPGVGFILSISFSLGWTALTDPDSFYAALKANVPAVLFANRIISELQKDAAETKQNLPLEWGQWVKACHVPPTQINGPVDTDTKASLDGVGQSVTFIKEIKPWPRVQVLGLRLSEKDCTGDRRRAAAQKYEAIVGFSVHSYTQQ